MTDQGKRKKKKNFPSWKESHNLTSQGILEIVGIQCAAHPKWKYTDSLCQECIFIFLLCFQSLSLFLLPVAVDHSESVVLKWILVQRSLYRNPSWPGDSHSAHKAKSLFPPSCPCWAVPSPGQIAASTFALTGHGPAINFPEHWFLHLKAIFVSLSVPAFDYPAGIFPYHKQNTKHSATEMRQNYCLEKHVWGLASCFSQQKFTDVSTASMQRNIWVWPFSTKRRWPACPILFSPNQPASANLVLGAVTPVSSQSSWQMNFW